MFKKVVLISLLLCLVFMPSCAARTVKVDDYGAVGDGLTDDSPAFNRCLSLGVPIELTQGKRYLIKTKIEGIRSDSFELHGNGATLVVDAGYPMVGYDNIFCFADGNKCSSSFILSDLNAEFLPGQKFPDKDNTLGDSYFIFIQNCRDVRIENVSLDTPSRYNNLTFFATLGVRKLKITDCQVRLNTLSRQGGAVWVMNKYFEKTDVKIKRCTFEYDTLDECFCLAALDLAGPSQSGIKAVVSKCSFISSCNSPSSGFIIFHNHFSDPARISAKFKNCSFDASGRYPRRILTYQSGEEKNAPEDVMNSSFVYCKFNCQSAEKSDYGLMGLGGVSDRPHDNYSISFDSCEFKVRGTHPLIGDKDGSRMGNYVFNNCTIDSEGEAFRKFYNVPTSKIYVSLNGRKTMLR